MLHKIRVMQNTALCLPVERQKGENTMNAHIKFYKSFDIIRYLLSTNIYLEGANPQQRTARLAMKNLFWNSREKLEKFIQILHPITKYITIFQGNKVAISEVLTCFQIAALLSC